MMTGHAPLHMNQCRYLDSLQDRTAGLDWLQSIHRQSWLGDVSLTGLLFAFRLVHTSPLSLEVCTLLRWTALDA